MQVRYKVTVMIVDHVRLQLIIIMSAFNFVKLKLSTVKDDSCSCIWMNKLSNPFKPTESQLPTAASVDRTQPRSDASGA